MMRRPYSVLIPLLFLVSQAVGQRSDLAGLKICLDPGHGGHNPANDRLVVPDPGVEFWESESNFQKALLLKPMLEARGATVFLTRTTNDYPNDNDEPSLAARVAFANANQVDWFHSIHSNATGLPVNTSINYTLLLVREMRSLTDPAASTGNGLGIPQTQEAWTIASAKMSPIIRSYLRTSPNYTYLDWTFYGGTNGGFSLGVLRGLLMPGELSEGSMHDFFPETRRLMNNDYRKLEAYALLRSWEEYFALPADTLGICAGIQKDVATGNPLNFTRVRLMPEGQITTGDNFNNGFYLFDGVPPGPHTIIFETPGVYPDSVDISVTGGSVTFADRMLQSAASPVVLQSSPAENDTLFNPTFPIVLNFSKPMDTASVRLAFSLSPSISGRFLWNSNSTMLTFTPDSILEFLKSYTLRIDTSARSATGQQIDGNGDGVPGDPYVLLFRTIVVDALAPFLTSSLPAPLETLRFPTSVLNFMFSEKLNPASVTSANFAIQKIGSAQLGRIVEYAEANGKSGVTMYIPAPVLPAASYRVRISGVADTAGNSIPTANPVLYEFSVAGDLYSSTSIDSMNGEAGHWLDPSASIGTTGIDSATFASSTSPKILGITGNPGSGLLKYTWSPGSGQHLLTLEMSPSMADAYRWTRSGILLIYLFGDGSGDHFRFVVDDSVEAFPSGPPDHREVSPWTTIDWVGWRLVGWDMERDSVGQWTGSGSLEGTLRFRALQFEKAGSVLAGQVFLDQLELAERVGFVGVAEGPPALPDRLELYQNFPNPFNPSTQIRFDVPSRGPVNLTVYTLLGQKVSVLVDGPLEAGRHFVSFDARGLASGVYLCRLTSEAGIRVQKMVLTR